MVGAHSGMHGAHSRRTRLATAPVDMPSGSPGSPLGHRAAHMLHFGCALPDGGHVGNAWPAWRTKIRREKGMSMEITQEIVKEFLSYDPDTGVFVWLPRDRRWLATDQSFKRWHTMYCGRQAGYQHKIYDGYFTRTIEIYGKRWQEHRLAFLYMTGNVPGIIDHMDGNPSNNSWENLRSSSYSGNAKNRVMSKNNTSGANGVSWHKRIRKWAANVRIDNRPNHIGYFDDFDDAAKAARAARDANEFSERHGATMRAEEFKRWESSHE